MLSEVFIQAWVLKESVQGFYLKTAIWFIFFFKWVKIFNRKCEKV